ncbi:uncharacterized protein MONBRDRAFT_7164 [Monosiga brevicollis MX1]|uniref:TauD/TfdA-like domain-containing protein n=1 Tax=Monosiga brevicollis TaxID=81824 RepID=A9UW47_MONBE|nr:uncharacterized protein MONBRDRAFT_7164 [Monosiga brevicollis MX1]EDQ90705.1 predicted protein [Monosiga brevicollis MX1]|eukprot:XP_001744756.1 hypothetical protein [Monosiga brevicollis MX1]
MALIKALTAAMRQGRASSRATVARVGSLVRLRGLSSGVATMSGRLATDSTETLGASNPRAWGSELTQDPSSLQYYASDKVEAELYAWCEKALEQSTNPDHVACDRADLPFTCEMVEHLEQAYLMDGPGLALLQPMPSLAKNIHAMRFAALAMSSCLGTPLVQNAAGDKSILVFDRDAGRKMVDGQRYHQSHEGGSMHTDNVNVPETWEYMLLTCLQPAAEGGESILLSSSTVEAYLAKHDPEALETLKEDFLWELRGFSERFYRAPILFHGTDGYPCFRWLREYLESAHARAGEPLTDRQISALNALTNATLEESLQLRYNMAKGEILFANDMSLLHGRTTFYDRQQASTEYDFGTQANRLLQRNWVKTKTSQYANVNVSRYAYYDLAE